MLLLGLTGSIATGKSTVSSLLSSPPYSLPVIDADILARQVVEPGTAGYAAIVEEFGQDVLLPATDPLCAGREDGPKGKGRPLNRPALGRAIFGEGEEVAKKRAVLNGIVHPAVRKEMWRLIVSDSATECENVTNAIVEKLLCEGLLGSCARHTIAV
jgi:dephospho-CoA kinase